MSLEDKKKTNHNGPDEDEPPPLPPDDEPPPMPPEDEPPPLSFARNSERQDQLKNLADKTSTFGRAVVSRGKAAGQLIAKQAERTKLMKLTLPGHYHALGKHIYAEGNYQNEFSTNYQATDALLGQIKAMESRSASEPKAEGIAAKAKAAAKATQDIVQVKALKMKLSHSLAGLGKAAFEKHGEESGPEELIRPIATARTRVEVLDAEIGQLSQSQAGQIFTPKRIAVAAVSCVSISLVAIIFGVSWRPRWWKCHFRTGGTSTRPTNRNQRIDL